MERTEGKVRIPEHGTNLYHIKAETKRICLITDLGHETQEDIADAKHIVALWNASEGMSTEDAVKALANFWEVKRQRDSLLEAMEETKDKLNSHAKYPRICQRLHKLIAGIKRSDNGQ